MNPNTFKQWLDEVFSDETGKGSNKRLSGFIGWLVIQGLTIAAVSVAIHVRNWDVVKYLIDADGIMTLALYGITLANNAMKKPDNSKTTE